MATVLQEIQYANLGWQYYKNYYKDNPGAVMFADRNETILNRKLKLDDVKDFILPKEYQGFLLKTTYPGLLIGSGYIHEAVGNDKSKTEAFKIGFFFDHITGMPYIPGSSVKGVLRSAFPLKDKKKEKYKKEKEEYIRHICNHYS
jgi:CRISPR-associated protein Cmr6